jgi:hypothetical protein
VLGAVGDELAHEPDEVVTAPLAGVADLARRLR